MGVSLSARRAWIEILLCNLLHDGRVSLSARRAWIEITNFSCQVCVFCVALRKESVDRNFNYIIRLYFIGVALRKESVDRNFLELSPWGGWGASLSARRAWIEIPALLGNTQNDGRRSPQGERG